MTEWKQFLMGKLHKSKGLRTIALTVVVALVLLCFTLPAFARNKYVITDGDHVIVCISSSSDPGQVIKEAGLELGESDTYTTRHADGVAQIEINRVQMIAVHDGEEMTVVGSYGGTVADVLESLDIELGESDVLSCEPDDETFDGMSVEITRVRQEEMEYEEVVPHGEKIYEDDSEPGEEVVLVAGQDGLRQIKALVSYEGGVETERVILSEQVIDTPVDRVVARGMDRSVKEQEYSGNEDYRPSDTTQAWIGRQPGHMGSEPSLPTENFVPGTNLRYKELKYMNATAYTNQREDGTYSDSPTAIGSVAREGAIAVDPSVIPLGSRLYIVSRDGAFVYGVCTAEDTGGAIQGDIVDLYYDTLEECYAFGRRDVVVYVLE